LYHAFHLVRQVLITLFIDAEQYGFHDLAVCKAESYRSLRVFS